MGEGEHVYVCAVLFCPSEQDTVQSKYDDQEDDCEWTITLQHHAEGADAATDAHPVQALTLGPGEQPVAGLLSADGSPEADSSTLLYSAPQVTTHTIHTHPTEVALLCALTSLVNEDKVKRQHLLL